MSNLRPYGILPISYDTLAEPLVEYNAPRDRVSRMQRQGQLIRLKRGVFVVSPDISQQELSLELIANHLYGPSYISMESALRFHGLIPERVFTTSSITLKRARSFDTPLGRFEYLTMPANYYPIGITQEMIGDSYTFLIATPEKALSDLIITTSGLRVQSGRAMREYLEEDLRLDFDEVESWDISIIAQCIEHGRKRRELNFLLEVLQNG